MKDLREQIENLVYQYMPVGVHSYSLVDEIVQLLQEQKPVAWITTKALELLRTYDPYYSAVANRDAGDMAPLYAAPMPSSVPEKLIPYGDYSREDAYIQGWNDAIDEVLAAAPKPEDAA